MRNVTISPQREARRYDTRLWPSPKTLRLGSAVDDHRRLGEEMLDVDHRLSQGAAGGGGLESRPGWCRKLRLLRSFSSSSSGGSALPARSGANQPRPKLAPPDDEHYRDLTIKLLELPALSRFIGARGVEEARGEF